MTELNSTFEEDGPSSGDVFRSLHNPEACEGPAWRSAGLCSDFCCVIAATHALDEALRHERAAGNDYAKESREQVRIDIGKAIKQRADIANMEAAKHKQAADLLTVLSYDAEAGRLG